jgi:hypothetical protein
MDPEALILFTLEVGRMEPRLFDELLDWLSVNQRLVSVQRLDNMARDSNEQSLVDATLSWAGVRKSPWRLRPGPAEASPGDDLVPLFHGLPMRGATLDEAFRARGFAKAATTPSKKSRPPDVNAPINFAFRLRHLLGVSARAEVIRCILTIDAPQVTAQVVARSAVYSKRNVQEALNALGAARVVVTLTIGGEQRYAVDRARWAPLFDLEPGGWPTHRDWPQLLGAVARIMRWLDDSVNEDLSSYMRASAVRDLLEAVGDDLIFAGVRVEPAPPGGGEEVWASFVRTIRNVLAALSH